MSKDEFVLKLTLFLWEKSSDKVNVLLDYALAYVNWYTFQKFSFCDFDVIPDDILSVLIDLVKNKYHEKIWVESERLSDYSISYSRNDLSEWNKVLLDKYRIIVIE